MRCSLALLMPCMQMKQTVSADNELAFACAWAPALVTIDGVWVARQLDSMAGNNRSSCMVRASVRQKSGVGRHRPRKLGDGATIQRDVDLFAQLAHPCTCCSLVCQELGTTLEHEIAELAPVAAHQEMIAAVERKDMAALQQERAPSETPSWQSDEAPIIDQDGADAMQPGSPG